MTTPRFISICLVFITLAIAGCGTSSSTDTTSTSAGQPTQAATSGLTVQINDAGLPASVVQYRLFLTGSPSGQPGNEIQTLPGAQQTVPRQAGITTVNFGSNVVFSKSELLTVQAVDAAGNVINSSLNNVLSSVVSVNFITPSPSP